MNEVLLIGGMAIVTFLVRYPALMLAGKFDMPRPIFEALRYVAPSVLAAIIVPAILLPDSHPIGTLRDSLPLISTIIAALVMWRTRSLLATIIMGMAAFALLRVLVH